MKRCSLRIAILVVVGVNALLWYGIITLIKYALA